MKLQYYTREKGWITIIWWGNFTKMLQIARKYYAKVPWRIIVQTLTKQYTMVQSTMLAPDNPEPIIKDLKPDEYGIVAITTHRLA